MTEELSIAVSHTNTVPQRYWIGS